MGQLTFQATLGGSINLVGPNTASTVNFTLPSADGSSGQSLQTNGSGTLSFALTSLTSGVTGTLPIANGGTGTTSTTFANLTTNVTGTLPIANGGTNSTATPTGGGIVYGTGTAYAISSAGSSGQVLTSGGSGAPTWATNTTSGLTFITSVDATASATLSALSSFSSTYDNYFVIGQGLQAASGTPTLYLRFAVGGTVVTTSSYFAAKGNNAVDGANQGGGAFITASNINMNTSDSNLSANMYFNIYDVNTTRRKLLFGATNSYENVSNAQTSLVIAGTFTSTSVATGIQLYWSGGQNFKAQGSLKIYGFKNS